LLLSVVSVVANAGTVVRAGKATLPAYITNMLVTLIARI